MLPPTTGSEIQQFICAMQWVKQGIPCFSEIVEPLHRFMEMVYTRRDKRTKRSVSSIRITDLGWGDSEVDIFERCKHAVATKATLM